MTATELAYARLHSQQIATTDFADAKSLVAWMGAMQAQDYNMVKWAIGIRIPNSSEAMIAAAMDRGEILRTHLLRPTWHLVAADDIYWILELTAPQIKKAVAARHKALELSEAIISKSNDLIISALARGKHLTREALVSELEQANIATTGNNRAAHLLLRAELDGVICSGKAQGNKQTYALLEEWVPRPAPISKEEALSKLAHRYFSSHCPATLRDFVWWSGLTVATAKRALEMVRSDFISETIDAQTYWFSESFTPLELNETSVYLLPAFDEYLISYKDRSAILPAAHFQKAISNNGIFRPTIVVNGCVTGIWKRTVKKDKVLIEKELFHPHDTSTLQLLEQAENSFADFLNKKNSA